VKVTVSGLSEATRTFGKVPPVVHRELVAITHGAADVGDRVATATVPRRTGRLASAIRVTGRDTEWVVGVDPRVSYAVYVELGTSRTPAWGFMRAGALAAETELQRGTTRLADRLPTLV
jgi:hypothetical protein